MLLDSWLDCKDWETECVCEWAKEQEREREGEWRLKVQQAIWEKQNIICFYVLKQKAKREITVSFPSFCLSHFHQFITSIHTLKSCHSKYKEHNDCDVVSSSLQMFSLCVIGPVSPVLRFFRWGGNSNETQQKRLLTMLVYFIFYFITLMKQYFALP